MIKVNEVRVILKNDKASKAVKTEIKEKKSVSVKLLINNSLSDDNRRKKKFKRLKNIHELRTTIEAA